MDEIKRYTDFSVPNIEIKNREQSILMDYIYSSELINLNDDENILFIECNLSDNKVDTLNFRSIYDINLEFLTFLTDKPSLEKTNPSKIYLKDMRLIRKTKNNITGESETYVYVFYNGNKKINDIINAYMYK